MQHNNNNNKKMIKSRQAFSYQNQTSTLVWKTISIWGFTFSFMILRNIQVWCSITMTQSFFKYSIFLKKKYFYLRSRITKIEEERESDWPLVRSPNVAMAGAGPVLSQKPGASSGYPRCMDLNSRPWAIPRCFPKPWAGRWIKSGATETQTGAQMGCCCHRQRLNLILHSTGPQVKNLLSKLLRQWVRFHTLPRFLLFNI